MYNRFDPFTAILTSMMVMFILIVYVGIGSNITIEKPHYDKWQSCEKELERTQPICPACECKTTGGIWYFIAGGILGFLIKIAFEEWTKEKKNKKKNKGVKK